MGCLPGPLTGKPLQTAPRVSLFCDGDPPPKKSHMIAGKERDGRMTLTDPWRGVVTVLARSTPPIPWGQGEGTSIVFFSTLFIATQAAGPGFFWFSLFLRFT